MNNKDFGVRLCVEDLIPAEIFQALMERKNREFSLFYTGSRKAKINGQKIKSTKLKEFLCVNGKLTNTYIENGKKIKRSMTIKSRKFELHHIDFGLLYNNVPLTQIRNISNILKNATESNYLGLSNLSKGRLKGVGKGHFIGLYVVEIYNSEKYDPQLTDVEIECKIKGLVC